MTTMHLDESRRRRCGLLTRPPQTDLMVGWSELVVDRVRQLEGLADLLDRGLLSRDEFETLVRRLALDVTPA